jgi:excisionase family DNA binding protein
MKRVKGGQGRSADDSPPVYLTRAEVSRMLGVSPNTVTRWAREGRLPSQVTLGGHHRFERALVEELRERLRKVGGMS